MGVHRVWQHLASASGWIIVVMLFRLLFLVVIAGHAPLAFALAAWGANALGQSRQRALTIGILAFGFAIVPDVDILHAVVGVFGSPPSNPLRANEVFWDASRELHRGITHSLVIGLVATIGFGFLRGSERRWAGGVGLLAGLIVLGTALGGGLGFAMTALYVLGGVGVVLVARHLEIQTAGTMGAAAVGLLTHPFGDLFTGTPPKVLYPIPIEIFQERLVLLPDPTLNLLAIFGLELAAIWLGLSVVSTLLTVELTSFIEPHAALGIAYGLMAFVLRPPTIDVAEPFVFSVLAMGGLGLPALVGRVDRQTLARGALTGLTAVTLGGCSYTVFYIIV